MKQYSQASNVLIFLVVAVIIVIISIASRSASSADIGETVNVARDTQSNGSEGFWICGSTTAAFDEMMKWVVRGDNDEIKRVMIATNSIALTSGLRVKILDTGFGKRKVRVVSNDKGEVHLTDEEGTFLADPRIGHECWVVSEALSR